MEHHGNSPKDASLHYWHHVPDAAPPLAEPARLDADGTAQPKTRIISHPNPGHCFGPGMALKDPELEVIATGERIPLTDQEVPDTEPDGS